MNHLLKKCLFLISSTISLTGLAQNAGNLYCPIIDAGPDVMYPCENPCTQISATYLEIRETTSYIVDSLPHVPPIPYNQPGGTAVSVNTDDVWSPIITLPFPFCYYGQTYTTCKIGSNGAILFNPTLPGGSHPWSFNASLTPTSGINGAGNVLGVYHDIDPSVCGSIRWYLVGTAPCRQFIVSFNELCHFSCTSLKSTHMMVLNEGTNYIDVYVQSKSTCNGWNGGRAVIGIQKINQNQGGLVAPGRNSTPNWNVTTPEAWRFKPNGAPLHSLEWLKDGVVIGTTDTIEVCPDGTTDYVARFSFTPCGSTEPYVITDTKRLFPSPGTMVLTSNITPTLCGQTNGAVDLQITGGYGDVAFSSDGVVFNDVTYFDNLSSGLYTYYAQDTLGCLASYTANVNDESTLTGTILSVQNPLCFGDLTGQITVQASMGNPPYTYSLNSGAPQTNGIFDNLGIGNYEVIITDNEGCEFPLDTLITQPTELNIQLDGTTNSSCNLPNGLIFSSAFGGVIPYNYTNNDFLSEQISGNFNNVLAGPYNIIVRDGNGCFDTISVVVDMDPTITLNLNSSQNVNCFGENNGEIQVTASVGPTPYAFFLNDAPQGTSTTYSNLTAGTYIVAVEDANNCIDTVHVVISQPEELLATTNTTETVCRGTPVIIEGFATGGTVPYTFIWNNAVSAQSLNPTPTATTTYFLKVVDANGCFDETEITQTVLPIPQAMATPNPNTGFAPLQVTFTNQSTNGTTFLWNLGNGETNTTSSILTPVNATYYTEDTFYVEMIATNGICSTIWYDTIAIVPFLSVEVPNVFTPNDNGVNDGYHLILRNATGIEATIVNRWGNVVKRFTNINDSWDGKNDSGKDHSDGVYFIKYTVYGYNNQEISGQTFFHLIR
jgi:large repetitive protein